MKLLFWLFVIFGIVGIAAFLLMRVALLGQAIHDNESDIDRERFALNVADRAVVLPNPSPAETTSLVFADIAIRLPWTGVTKKRQDLPFSYASLQNGIVCLIANQNDWAKDILAIVATNEAQRAAVAEAFEASDKQTLFVLYQLIAHHRQSEAIKFNNSSQSAVRKVQSFVVENSKAGAEAINRVSHFSIGMTHGIQYGDPRYTNLIFLVFFVKEGTQYDIFLSGKVTQPEIDFLLSTLTVT